MLNTKIEDLADAIDKKEKALLRFTEILEEKYKNLTLWSTINSLWIIVLTIVILSLI
jgi:hypothetical protein